MNHSDYDDDFPRRRRSLRCHDGFCGADDCPTCRPGCDQPEPEEPSMHTYLNNLVCAAAPCDGEMQDAIEHAIRTGQFKPTGVLLADNETIGRDGAAWLTSYREHLDRVAKAHSDSLELMFAAIHRAA